MEASGSGWEYGVAVAVVVAAAAAAAAAVAAAGWQRHWVEGWYPGQAEL